MLFKIKKAATDSAKPLNVNGATLRRICVDGGAL